MIDYQGNPKGKGASSSNSSADPIHDIYLPTGLLILGFLTLLAWIVSRGKWGIAESIVLFAFINVLFLVIAAMMCLVTWFITRKFGGSFGNAPTTILKITALVILIESVFPWLMVGMRKTGMISASGGAPPRGTVMLEVLIPAFIALFVARFVYQLGDDEAQVFGWVVAVGTCVVNVVLVLVMAVVLHLLIAAKTRTAAVAVASSAAKTSATTHSAATAIATTPAERRIARYIRQNHPTEGRDWKLMYFPTKRNKPIRRMIDQLYAAGARRVYLETKLDSIHSIPQPYVANVYVELPAENTHRTACVTIAQTYRGANGSADQLPRVHITGRFLTIELQ
jgi:hypothetical protein